MQTDLTHYGPVYCRDCAELDRVARLRRLAPPKYSRAAVAAVNAPLYGAAKAADPEYVAELRRRHGLELDARSVLDGDSKKQKD